MSDIVFVIAPHPDDEVLGCGGTLLKLKNSGAIIHWIIVTKMGKEFTDEQKKERQNLVSEISKIFGFKKTHQLLYVASNLVESNLKDIIIDVSHLIKLFSPSIIFTPFYGDIHSDHRIISNAVISACKPFRASSVKSLLAYEVISETNFGFKELFNPIVYYDITDYFHEKISILQLYKTEIKEHPFPRSVISSTALAQLRGSESNNQFAEAFQPIRIIL